MISKVVSRFAKLVKRSPSYFFTTTIDPQGRFEMIRNHPPLTEYPNLNALTAQHKYNTTRLIKDDETNLSFLVEQAGFPACATLGICIQAGFQNQTYETSGSISYLKNYVHMKPEFEDSVKNYEFFQQTGSSFFFNEGVEDTYITCTFFEEDADVMVNLLLDLAFRQKQMLEDDFQTQMISGGIDENMRRTAFGQKGLGMPRYGSGNLLSQDKFIKFQRENITPHGTVISMSNIKNPQNLIAKIKQKLHKNYSSFLARPPPKKVQNKYVGGMGRFPCEQNSPLFQFAVALPAVQYRSDKMELYQILRVMLGNASSFSSGGPGKGMHSRCTKHLMNKQACVEKCSYILNHFQNSGLFGLTVGGPHEERDAIINVTMKQFKRLREDIPPTQLQRSKNMLLAQVYANVERQSQRLQELTKHLHCYGRIKLNEFQRNIKEVTASMVQAQMKRIFKLKPTFVVCGLPQDINSVKPQPLAQFLLK